MSEIEALTFAAKHIRETRDKFLQEARGENWKLRRVEKQLADEIAKAGKKVRRHYARRNQSTI